MSTTPTSAADQALVRSVFDAADDRGISLAQVQMIARNLGIGMTDWTDDDVARLLRVIRKDVEDEEPKPETPAPGVYPGIPMARYHPWDAASHSRLTLLMRSPAHLRAHLDEPYQDTPALAFGRAAHTAILEPDSFASRYTIATQCIAETKQKKRCSKMGTVPVRDGESVCAIHAPDYTDDLDSREVLTPQDWRHCIGMRDSIHAIERARTIIEGLGEVEVSVRWDDPETGLPCKGRWDGYATVAGGCILDLKTTVDASRRAFERSIFTYGYHRQGALYLASAKAHSKRAKHYVIIAVEKERPYGACIYRLTEGAIEAGEEQNKALLARYAECLANDHWPCYPTDVQDVGLPAYAWNQLQEQVQ